ncbi:MAG: monothiol bacilliredoxin BrxC family protein [Planctomycetota bacterium]
MTETREIQLPSDPNEAAAALRDASSTSDVVVFKKSPICPVSTRAEFEFKSWLSELGDDDPVRIAWIDVIAEKPLARGLTAALGVEHQSPQALWFSNGELAWHDSHGALTRDRFAEASKS